MHATLDTTLSLTQAHCFYSTPTTGYDFATAGYIPVEMVFFNENTVPSLTARWQGPSSTIFTVSILHLSSHSCCTSKFCCQTASDHPFVSIHAVCIENRWAALSMRFLQHQRSPVYPACSVLQQKPDA